MWICGPGVCERATAWARRIMRLIVGGLRGPYRQGHAGVRERGTPRGQTSVALVPIRAGTEPDSADLTSEVEGRDVQSLAHVEAMGRTALDTRVQVDDMATGASGSADELGEEQGAYATASFGSEGDEVVHVQLPDGGGVCHDSPTGDTNAAILVIRCEVSEPLRVALRVDGGQDGAGQVRTQLAQHCQDIPLKPGISGLDVVENHDKIVACAAEARVDASARAMSTTGDWMQQTDQRSRCL